MPATGLYNFEKPDSGAAGKGGHTAARSPIGRHDMPLRPNRILGKLPRRMLIRGYGGTPRARSSLAGALGEQATPGPGHGEFGTMKSRRATRRYTAQSDEAVELVTEPPEVLLWAHVHEV
ncbi:hypothetical protein CSOJ01_14282 [Colletotrichum sojae]|uniref:Uncharacterized protein n=1 Tax=Colletotrichum sojae TaxID=2175907 RepID=A0A8H6IQX5_9PEZI|nr:hypothetical protein CSOJ01_14282 [Colletotrichum sojae]